MRLQHFHFNLCTSIDDVSLFISNAFWSGLLWPQNKIWIQPFCYLKGCSGVLEMGNVEIWRAIWGEVKCPLVTGLWCILSQLSFDSAAPLTLSTPRFVKANLCEKNLQHSSLQTKASNIYTFQAFCSQMSLYANLGSIMFLMKENVQVRSGGLLLFTLCSSF